MSLMLPSFRVILATTTAALALMALAMGVLAASRTGSLFAIGLRSAQGSPIERALPEAPDWRQFVAREALRRSAELDRLLDLPTGTADAVGSDGAATAAGMPPADATPSAATENAPVPN